MMGSDGTRLHDECSDGRRPWTAFFWMDRDAGILWIDSARWTECLMQDDLLSILDPGEG
jgi:hypothetical protein